MNTELMAIIKNQAELLRSDVDAIRAVLEVVEPDVFMAAFGQLKPSRQAALTGLSLEDPEMATNKQQEETSGKISSR